MRLRKILMKGGRKLTLYENIKENCEKKNISILQMEKDLDFPRSSICKWNKNEPGVFKVEKVACYLGVKVDELLSKVERGK